MELDMAAKGVSGDGQLMKASGHRCH